MKKNNKFNNFNSFLAKNLRIVFPMQPKHKVDIYINNLLKTKGLLFKELDIIIKSKNLSTKQKQLKLEALMLKPKKYSAEQDRQIPKELKPLIAKVDETIKNTKISDLTSFLPQNMFKKCKKKFLLTNKRQKAFKVLSLGLQLFLYKEYSFGLFLISSLLFYLRTNSIQDYNGRDMNPTIHLIFHSDKTLLNRLTLISVLGNQFFKSFNGLKTQIENELLAACKTAKNKNFLENLGEQTKIELIREKYGSETVDLFKKLISDELSAVEQELIEKELGIFFLLILEEIDLIKDKNLKIKQLDNIKTWGNLELNENYINPIFKIPFSPYTLPMLEKPNNWLLVPDKKINLCQGGFLYNSELGIDTVLGLPFRREKILITDGEIAAINYLQSNFYSVNKKYLKALSEYSPEILENYLQNYPDFYEIFSIKNSLMDILSFESYCMKDHELSTIKELKKTKQNSVKFEKRVEILRNRYINIINSLFNFILCYCLAEVYKNSEFYFTVFTDARGRLYYSTGLGCFGLQSGGLPRNLIKFCGNKFFNKPILIKKSESNTETDSENSENLFDELKVEAGIKTNLVTIDASASGSSIISGLVGYKGGLALTNVFVTQKPKKPEDIYTTFAKFLNQQASFSEIFPNNFIEKLIKIEKVKREKIVNFLSLIHADIDRLLERKHMKAVLMRLNYSQQNIGRAKYIEEHFSQKIFACSEFKNFKMKQAVNYRLAQWLEANYKKAFPLLYDFNKIVKTQISHKKPLILKVNFSGHFEIKTCKGVVVRTIKPVFNGSLTQSKLSFFSPTDEIDTLAAGRAATANFIHFLDSRICLNVIKKCMDGKILVYSNHDSFTCQQMDREKIKQFYFESYFDICVKNDTFEEFLKINNVKENSVVENFLKKSKTNRMLIIKNFEEGLIFPSPFILK